ncbi:hypothetical protein [Clostridium sp. UBA1056]|uniref:hypothetical protein n=1 Tax=unclassified Clostridium TaxID=2614128 RepID=UPI003216A2D4
MYCASFKLAQYSLYDSAQKELESIRDSIYDENTKEVKSELSTGEFAQIVREFTWRYVVCKFYNGNV